MQQPVEDMVMDGDQSTFINQGLNWSEAEMTASTPAESTELAHGYHYHYGNHHRTSLLNPTRAFLIFFRDSLLFQKTHTTPHTLDAYLIESACSISSSIASSAPPTPIDNAFMDPHQSQPIARQFIRFDSSSCSMPSYPSASNPAALAQTPTLSVGQGDKEEAQRFAEYALSHGLSAGGGDENPWQQQQALFFQQQQQQQLQHQQGIYQQQIGHS
jgi:hypothetical protein